MTNENSNNRSFPLIVNLHTYPSDYPLPGYKNQGKTVIYLNLFCYSLFYADENIQRD